MTDQLKLTNTLSIMSQEKDTRFHSVLQGTLTRLKQIVSHPVTHFNLLSIGVLIMIGAVHNAAHFDIETDVHGYCHNLERDK